MLSVALDRPKYPHDRINHVPECDQSNKQRNLHHKYQAEDKMRPCLSLIELSDSVES